jgi:hypothetical protein
VQPDRQRLQKATQRQAATYSLTIPAPRGQITDRNGIPLAQNRVSYNLSIVFPTPFEFTDRQVVEFVGQQVTMAKSLTSRLVGFSEEEGVRFGKPFIGSRALVAAGCTVPPGMTVPAGMLAAGAGVEGHPPGWPSRRKGEAVLPGAKTNRRLKLPENSLY